MSAELSTVSGMAKPKQAEWYWHVHHDSDLAERGDGIRSRIDCIRREKPGYQIEMRLALLTRVRDQAALNRYQREFVALGWRAPYEKAQQVRERLYARIVALHDREHPGCPARVVNVGSWMPTGRIFAKGYRLTVKKRRRWMSRRGLGDRAVRVIGR